MPKAKIGVLYHDVGYGPEYLNSFKDALGAEGRKLIVSEQSFSGKDAHVDKQLDALKKSGADVFFNIALGRYVVMATKQMAAIGWKPAHFLISPAATKGFMQPAGLVNFKGAISITAFKSPTDPRWKDDPAMKDHYAFMKEYVPEVKPEEEVAVIAHTQAQALIHVLKVAGKDLSKENILAAATNINGLALPLLVPGGKIITSPQNRAPIHHVMLTRFDGENWLSFGDSIEVGL
jgi:ABC-type branched-subunit amino acid transport system substrate-binding protein